MNFNRIDLTAFAHPSSRRAGHPEHRPSAGPLQMDATSPTVDGRNLAARISQGHDSFADIAAQLGLCLGRVEEIPQNCCMGGTGCEMGLDAFRLDGKTAVVTGAASGIGRAAAELFADVGANVILADHASSVADTAAAIPRAIGIEIDLTEPGAPGHLVAQVERSIPIDIWVNVAGVVGTTPIGSIQRDEYYRIMRVNLDAVVWCCDAVAPYMRKRGRGTIINVSSNAADKAAGGLAAYAASKGGVNSLTRVLAEELGPDGIRVNALAPGFIMAGTTVPSTMVGEEREAFLALHAARSPMGITGLPTDTANALLYLASDASRFMTGQILRVNGGSTML